ncbi:Negative regulator of mitotic exit [Tulasnella sp. 424]|nr:Negative regulator of mitotic exit [Tulasnella sp. 424]KAG8962654.1 Negative regulator of mitotic exit [Tulasnella sp. 425]
MLGRALGWLVETLTLDFPIIDDQTQPEDVQATRTTSRSTDTEPRHGASSSRSSRKGRPKTSVEDTTGHGSLTTHSRVDLKSGSPAATIDEFTAQQEIFTSEGLTVTPRNTSHSTEQPEVNSNAPYALTWTEHDLELKDVKAQENSGSKSDSNSRDTSSNADDPMGHMTHGVFPRREHSCTAIPKSDGEFIIFGGRVIDGDQDTWTNDIFLLSTTDWSLSSLETNGVKPEVRAGHGAAIVGRVLVVFGGAVDDSHLHFLNLDTREWSKLRPPAPYPGPRYGHSFIIVDNTIWLFGGQRKHIIMDDMWCIEFGSDDVEYVRWRRIPKKKPWPEARAYHSTVYHGGSLYLFAGTGEDHKGAETIMNDVWKFEIRTETWTEIRCYGQLPPPRSAPGATFIGDNMFTFGGLIPVGDDMYELTDYAFVFNSRDQTWRGLALLGHSPPPTKGDVLFTLGSRLVIVGGHDEDRELRIHTAETRAAGSARDSLAKLQFTTETNQLNFTTEVVDLSRFVRKQGDAAHSLAGFSDVWKGEMTGTGQPIAIKVLRVVSTGDPDDPQSGRLRTRFDRELTIWMECQHPRVLELLGYAYIEGVPCLVSPWCSNGNIMEYLAKNPNADHIRLIAQVAEGLVYLHGREPSVVHSDIKPANVVVSDEGNAKICDFGISKLVQENPSGFTTTTSVKGTLRYSSPEMLDLDGMSTTSSDVWAFGMLILHVRTNKLPYVTVLSDVKVILAIINGEKPLPENYPELPAADPLWDIMRECWDDDPAKRPGMVDLFDKLQRCAQTRDDE